MTAGRRDPADRHVKCFGPDCSNDAPEGTIWCAACQQNRKVELEATIERISKKVAAKTTRSAPERHLRSLPRPPERRDTDG